MAPSNTNDDSKKQKEPTYTLAEGCPMADATTQQRFGNDIPVRGLMLLQDTQLIETLAHFSRERIPERTVHAGAVGALGEFEVTKDNSHLTSAKFLNGIGKKSPLVWRLSITGPERGNSETVRDVRGWAMKIKTEEGNQDFVFNNIPVFFVRDPIKFPSMNRSHKRAPALNAPSDTMFWDFHTNNQEGIHAIMMLFSNRGIPHTVRHVNGYSGSTYKFTKDDGTFSYVKIHFKSNQGAKGMDRKTATRLAGEEPQYYTKDMWNAIEKGDYPSWTMYAQVMSPEDAKTYRWNIFDTTQIWPHSDYPLQELGKFTLNKNPTNYYSDIEQAAFSPSTMVAGIAPSLDPILQARMFAYPDAARYRLGANYQQLPTNRPVSEVYQPYERDGAMRYMTNYGDDPNYVRSQLKPINFVGKLGSNGYSTGHDHAEWAGLTAAYTSEVTDKDFVQAKTFWDMLGKQDGEQEAWIGNVVSSLKNALPVLQVAALEMFSRVSPDISERIQEVMQNK